MKTIYSSLKPPVYPYPFLQPIEKIGFFDIETTGLSSNASSIYLIGFLYFDSSKKEWTLCQWFADNYQSEKEIIVTFFDHLSNIEYLYHFNGKTFDIPYVLKKCKRHAVSLTEHCSKLLNDTTGCRSIDLLGKIRSLRHALMLDKCSQIAVERWLGIKRTDPFSGGELITVYSEYMQQKILNPENAEKLEKVLLLHNHDDIEMMLNLCSLLTYDEYLSEACTNRLLTKENLSTMDIRITSDQTVSISLNLPAAVPKTVHLMTPYPETSLENSEYDASLSTMLRSAELSFEENKAYFTFSVYEGSLKYFLPDYKDYYYLPKEDTAIHKSVAEFVDSAFRKKATAATCYIKKEGKFLPNLSFPSRKKAASFSNPIVSEEPAFFYLKYKDKLTFCELPENFIENTAFWKQYLSRQLPYFR